jgi:ATP-dependent Lhr-like helicase
MPKGRVFPTSRDDLVECGALLRSIRAGLLDAIVRHDAPLDVLAQQIVAECACCEYSEDDLFTLVTRAWPYRDLERASFDAVLSMTAEGFATRRGRRAALVHRDEVNASVRGRRGSRLLAQTSGGAIPEIADYRVILDPDDTFIGTLNEDFAIESNAGDVFQLGNSSWLILQVTSGDVRVADAKGAPPTIPFWLGEAPARSDELSRAVSDLRADIDRRLDDQTPFNNVVEWVMAETGLDRDAADQIVSYLADGRRVLDVVPSQETLVLERFFDEAGGMQLVLHAPFGSRINKAWGLALRKRFCRQFNFELQAAATEDALMLSLGPQHSFPLSDVFRYLHPETTKDVLVQAFLDAPVFKTRWRWNTTISLAVPRARGGRKVAPQIQRMQADDLMAAVFPDAAACLENIPGDRQIPDHPLVSQAVRDCLEEAMDFDGLRAVLQRIHRNQLRLVARDTPEPSVFAHEILNARPYAFLDDAPLEERRSHAVQARRTIDPASAGDISALDQDAIDRVRDQEHPDPRDADELHDALLTAGFLTTTELEAVSPERLAELSVQRRAGSVGMDSSSAEAARVVVAVERLPELRAIHPNLDVPPSLQPPASRLAKTWTRDDAIAEIVRGRLTLAGPITSAALADQLRVSSSDIDAALLRLEADGVVLRGRFTPGERELEWCDRTLLARIHRYTLNRLRAEIEPVAPADFMRFLFRWQHVETSSRLTGLDGLREVIASLDGYELAASAWERAVLPARLDRYDASMLDMLCLAGEAAWARLSRAPIQDGPTPALIPATPIALFLRPHADAWRTLRGAADEAPLGEVAHHVLSVLRSKGASFFNDLAAACGLESDQLRQAIGELVANGLVTSDGFSGLRALVWAARGRPMHHDRRNSFAGRWTAIAAGGEEDRGSREEAIELQAWALLRRYGVVFRRVLARETNAATWRELARVYRRLEARGEIRSGRFVTGMSGEQFALPDAVERLREVRRIAPDGTLVTISAADPLNLTGIVTAGERIRTAGRNRIVYRDGIPIAVTERDFVRDLVPFSSSPSYPGTESPPRPSRPDGAFADPSR